MYRGIARNVTRGESAYGATADRAEKNQSEVDVDEHCTMCGLDAGDRRAAAGRGRAAAGSLRCAPLAQHRSLPRRSRHRGSDGFFHTGSVGAVSVSQSNPNIVYVGMGEGCLRGNLSSGDGVYKSTDAGRTWTHVGLADSSQIGRMQIHPTNPDIVYVAAIGHPYGPNAERGVFRSKDGGTTWQKVLYVNDQTGAADIAMDATDPQVLYATTWQMLRTPWDIYSTGPGGGLYKSTDGGDTWTRLSAGLPPGNLGKIGVTVSPANPGRVWATVEADAMGGVYRSDDAGRTWQLLNDDFNMTARQYYYGHIFADPVDANTMYTFCAKYFYKSTDGGKTYTSVQTPHGDYHDLWIDPRDPKRMVNGSDGGASVTFNGGRTWSSMDNQPTAQFYAVITDHGTPYRVYGSQQDNTTVSIASRTNGAGITGNDWHSVGGGESGYLAPTPSNPPVVFGGSYFGLMTRYDERTGESQNVTVWPDYNGGRTAAAMKYRFQWTYPIIVSPHDGNTVYAGAQVVLRSANGGRSWATISPDLTRNDTAKQKGGRLEEYYSTIFTIAESPREKGVIWTGSDDGLIHLTRNGGRDWQNVTPPAIRPFTRINMIDASPHDPATAFVAVNRYQLDDFHPYIFKTTDYGRSWQAIANGLPARSFVRTVREDPKRRNLLYAGTETGVHFSLDGGRGWQSLQLNLPVVPITDLTVKDNDLIASTQGRAFWILDDVTPLHELGDAVTTAAHLFATRDAVRTRRAGFGRAPDGIGQNPPGGASVSYWLGRAQDVTLEFVDSKGVVVKTATSREGNGPAATAGMHRFTWDMRYPDAHGIEGGTFLAGGTLRGPVAVPGTYQVRLKTGGETLSQSLRIVADSRSQASAADLQEQFDLLTRIRDKVTEVHDAVNDIVKMRKALASRKDAASAKLDAALEAVQKELVDLRFAGYDDQMLVFDLKLNNRMAALQGYVSQGDYAPTEQQYSVFREVSSLVDAALARYAALKAQAPEGTPRP
ncbi:MAG: glycosyl hydrolase [Acidobacteria bacterium]|nr:MAG: glycosyl hydrolase [Acidobacteriota bacterium]